MNNNKDVQNTTINQLPSYYSVTKALNVSDSFIFSPLIVDVHSSKSKCMTKNKHNLTTTANAVTKKQNNINLLIPVTST